MVLLIGLLACATGHPAALGWSLGGEAHVFMVGDKFARDFYRELTGSSHLADSLSRRPLVAVEAKRFHAAIVSSANGTAGARLTLARFHASRRCGYEGLVTELVFEFPPGGAGGRGAPPSHVPVVALLESMGFAADAGPTVPRASRQASLELVNRVARRAADDAPLLRPLALDDDQAADAGEVVVAGSRYGVGFRARVLAPAEDTSLVTGVAVTDTGLRQLRWVVRPQRTKLQHGVLAPPRVRYSLRGSIAAAGGGVLLLIDEFADVKARDSRATAVDPATGRVLAAQPLALHCP